MKRVKNKSNISIIKDYLEGSRPFAQIGYTPKPKIKRKIGEVWKDEDGVEWIQTKSGKISKKLNDITESTRKVCSICGQDIKWSNNHNDEKMFNKTGKCYDCVIEEENKMRINGTYPIYEKIKIINNQKTFLLDLKQKIKESISYLEKKDKKIQFVNGDGSIESWSNASMDSLLKEATNDLSEVDKSLILCDASISMLEKQLDSIKNNK